MRCSGYAARSADPPENRRWKGKRKENGNLHKICKKVAGTTKAGQKKICFFSGDITRSGGTERAACLIANGLARRGEYEVCVLSLTEQAEGNKPFFWLDDRIAHTALGKRKVRPGLGCAALLWKLRRFFRQQNIDVVVDIDIVLDALSVPAAFGTRTKVVSWEHFHFGYETGVRFGYRDLIVRHVTTKTDGIITLTERDRKAFLQGLRRPPQVFVIPNPMREAKKCGQEGKKKWIVTTGRLVPEKGMDYLVRTARIVLTKYPDWKWVLLGDGRQREWLQSQVRAYHLEGKLLLQSQVADVDTYLEQAQIFVLTSRREGLPMCLLEAKAHGLACVSFDIETGPGEIIADGVNGFLIPPYDCKHMARCIGQLIEDHRLRRTFMLNAGQGREKYQLDTVLDQWSWMLGQIQTSVRSREGI